MAIEMAQNVNSLSSQDQGLKENTKIQVKQQDVKKQKDGSRIISEAELKNLIATLENGIKQFNRKFKFDINKEINRIIVKVIDKDTEKVIREIPPSEIQNLLVKIKEAIGLLFDTEI